MNWKKYQKYTQSLLKNSIIHVDPYPHIIVQNCFHPELFSAMKIEWPSNNDSWWVSNTPGLNINRKQYALPNSNNFWKNFYFYMIDNFIIKDTILNKFQINHIPTVTSSTLWEDSNGYSVGPHVDRYKIVVAWQTYIFTPPGATGTELYYNDKGPVAKVVSASPNTAWIMINNDTTWHGLSKQDISSSRSSLMTRFMKY